MHRRREFSFFAEYARGHADIRILKNHRLSRLTVIVTVVGPNVSIGTFFQILEPGSIFIVTLFVDFATGGGDAIAICTPESASGFAAGRASCEPPPRCASSLIGTMFLGVLGSKTSAFSCPYTLMLPAAPW